MRVLLFDANILIDYFDAEPAVFAAIRNSVGEIFILERVLAEVQQLDALQAAELGLKIFEPTLEQMREAAAHRGGLSFQDHLCLAVAREEGMTCVTNDLALRTRCTQEKVAILWGLELLLLAVEKGGLPRSDAAEIGRAICAMNPRIGIAVQEAFFKRLR